MARVAIVGRLPTENQGDSRACLGVYHEIPALTNAQWPYTAYRNEDDKVKQALWYVNADSGWVIGDSEDIGADEGVMYAPGDVARVELVKSPWRCWDWRQQLIDAGDLEVLSKPVTSAAAKVPAAKGDVQVVGERSWEQKDAEGRKNAVTLEPDTPTQAQPQAKRAPGGARGQGSLEAGPGD